MGTLTGGVCSLKEININEEKADKYKWLLGTQLVFFPSFKMTKLERMLNDSFAISAHTDFHMILDKK